MWGGGAKRRRGRPPKELPPEDDRENHQPDPAQHKHPRAPHLDHREDDPPGGSISVGDGRPPPPRSHGRRDPCHAKQKGKKPEPKSPRRLPEHWDSVCQPLAFLPVARILLLGSTGFFGRGVAHKLLDAGHQLRVLVRDPMKAAAFKVRGAQVVVGDALNPAAVTQAAQGVEHMISLVAVRRNRPQSFLEVNVDGPRLLGQAAKAAGVQSVVLVSAIGARLDAHYKYLTSRWMGEQELAKSGVAGTILRFSLVLAEEGGSLKDFERLSKIGPFVIIPDYGETQLQPILREDAARCVVETIGRQELLGKIVELGGPEVVTFKTVYGWFLDARGIKKPRLTVPPGFLIPGAAIMEILMKDPPVTPDEIKMFGLNNIADGIDSVSTHYGWRPTAPSTWVPEHWKKAPARK